MFLNPKIDISPTGNRFCFACGSSRREGARFCEECGVKFANQSSEVDDSSSRTIDTPAHYLQDNRDISYSAKKKSSPRRPISLGRVLFALLLLVGVIAVIGMIGGSNSTNGITSSYDDDSEYSEAANDKSPLSLTASLQGKDWWGRSGRIFVFEVSNIGSEPIGFFGSINMITTSGESYLGIEARQSNEIKYLDIFLNPNASQSFTALFDAPPGTRVSKFQIVQGTDDGTDGVLTETNLNYVFPSN